MAECESEFRLTASCSNSGPSTSMRGAAERQGVARLFDLVGLSVDDHAMHKFNGVHGLPTGAMADLLPTRHSTGDNHGIR